jgi:RimJ/RimL family protein N-acetyltransferase
MPQPVLKASGGLLLRPWAAIDAPALYQASLDPEIQKWNKWRLDSEDEARVTISGWREAWRQEAAAHWAVIRSGDRTLVGRVALIAMRLIRGVAEVAYWTAPWARGAGVAPIAVETLAEFAIDQVGFHRLELVHSMANQASCRVALKCGFADEASCAGSPRTTTDGTTPTCTPASRATGSGNRRHERFRGNGASRARVVPARRGSRGA